MAAGIPYDYEKVPSPRREELLAKRAAAKNKGNTA